MLNKPKHFRSQTVIKPAAHSQLKNMEHAYSLSLDSGEVLLRIDEVAEMLRVTQMTVRRIIERRLMPVYRIGRGLRFRAEDVKAFVERQKTPLDGEKGAYASPKD